MPTLAKYSTPRSSTITCLILKAWPSKWMRNTRERQRYAKWSRNCRGTTSRRLMAPNKRIILEARSAPLICSLSSIDMPSSIRERIFWSSTPIIILFKQTLISLTNGLNRILIKIKRNWSIIMFHLWKKTKKCNAISLKKCIAAVMSAKRSVWHSIILMEISAIIQTISIVFSKNIKIITAEVKVLSGSTELPPYYPNRKMSRWSHKWPKILKMG